MPEAGRPELAATPVRLCASSELEEGGLAHSFQVLEGGRDTVPAFALRFEGQVVAYLNRCAHVPTEMDWQAGRFLDDQGQWIICATHGAVYDPRNGLCVAGPCASRSLVPLAVGESDGQVYWYPSPLYQPAFVD